MLNGFYKYFTDADINTLRYAFGSTIALGVAMGFDWKLAYLTPVLTLTFLASKNPAPNLKSGFGFLTIILIATLTALIVGRVFLPYPFVFMPVVGILIFRIYYARGVFPPALILWLIIAVLVIPLAMMQSNLLANLIAINLLVDGIATLVIVWLSYFVFPYKRKSVIESKEENKPNRNQKDKLKTSINITIVVLPAVVLFYYYEMISSILILIMIALLSMQPGFTKDFKSGKVLIIGNLIGGIAAILFYETLLIIPEYYFLLIGTLFLGLIFGRGLFSGKPKAALYGMAYSTLLVIIGSTTSSNAEAGAKVYSRIIQIMLAVIYVVISFGLLEHFSKFNFPFKKFRNKTALLLGLTALITSCSVGPNFVKPDIVEDNAYQNSISISDSVIVNLPWWEMFGDTVLQSLILEALENNLDLKVSLSRINEAQASLGIVESNLFPTINYSGNSAYDGKFGNQNNSSSVSGLASIGVSYEVDLWGRVSRMNEVALQNFLMSKEVYRGITISLVSEVAKAYILLRDIDNRLIISEYTAEARLRSLDVIKAKYDAGIVAEVDVNQSEIQLADARAAVKNYERIRSQTENAISLLLSKPPMKIDRGLKLEEQIVSPTIPIGLPSSLLSRRPDLLIAEKKLHAQTARIGMAEALKYPQIILSADLGAQFANITNGFASLTAQLFGPLFDYNATELQVDVEKERTQQLLLEYKQAFYSALREVEDAIIAANTYEEEYKVRRDQVIAAQNAADLSWVRYEGGMTSYLEVLDVQRSLFTAQIKSSETLQQRLKSIIRLYKALGGGWSPENDRSGYFN